MLSPWPSASSGAAWPRSSPPPSDSLPSPSLSWLPLSLASLSPSSAGSAYEIFSSPDYGAWGRHTPLLTRFGSNFWLMANVYLYTQLGAHNPNYTGYIIMVLAREHFEYLPHFFRITHILQTIYLWKGEGGKEKWRATNCSALL